MAAMATRAAGDRATLVDGSLEAQECSTIVRFENPPGRVRGLSPRNDHYVYSC